jgi:hypothetical protein
MGTARPKWRTYLWALLFAPCTFCHARGNDFLYFNTEDISELNKNVPIIQPWKIVFLDPEYGGQWVVASDLNGDGIVDIVTAENFNKDDVHYTSTAVAQSLDGSVVWRWGNPDVGRKNWHHDVACQIHDWNGDGKNEVVLCTKGLLVELAGATGRELRRIPIPEEATDCLVFCNLSGDKNPTDVLVKDRYHQIWAYDQRGRLLWTVKDPGGFRTAHQPQPLDIDGDGRDEIMAGYALLNHDGSVRWVFRSKIVEQSRGHLDCARVLYAGASPTDFRIVLTCCGANDIALVDGNGQVLWEVPGHHFESVDVGCVMPDHPGRHIVVDIDHQPYGNSPVWVLDDKGRLLGQIITAYSRHHCLADWTGDGVDEICIAHNAGLYNHQGRRIGTFSTPGLDLHEAKMKYETSMLIGDMTSDGIPDVIIATPYVVYIYKNTEGKRPDKPVRIGTESNFTLY